MLKMRVESRFKECSRHLDQWPWELEKGITRDMLKINQVV